MGWVDSEDPADGEDEVAGIMPLQEMSCPTYIERLCPSLSCRTTNWACSRELHEVQLRRRLLVVTDQQFSYERLARLVYWPKPMTVSVGKFLRQTLR